MMEFVLMLIVNRSQRSLETRVEGNLLSTATHCWEAVTQFSHSEILSFLSPKMNKHKFAVKSSSRADEPNTKEQLSCSESGSGSKIRQLSAFCCCGGCEREKHWAAGCHAAIICWQSDDSLCFCVSERQRLSDSSHHVSLFKELQRIQFVFMQYSLIQFRFCRCSGGRTT